MDANNFRSHWNDLNIYITNKLNIFFDKLELYFPNNISPILNSDNINIPIEKNLIKIFYMLTNFKIFFPILEPLAKKYNMHTKYTHISSDTIEGHLLRFIFNKINFEIQPSILTSWLWLIELFSRVIKNKNIEFEKLNNRIDFIDPNDHILCRVQCNKFTWNQVLNRLNTYLSVFINEIKATCDVKKLDSINSMIIHLYLDLYLRIQ